jgi:hypothetical protein
VRNRFVVTNKPANQRAASVTYDPVANRFLVLWIDDENGPGNTDIWRSVLLPGGGVYSAPARLLNHSAAQKGPYARYDYGNNQYFMVWFDNRNGLDGILGSRVDAGGNLLDGTGKLISTSNSVNARNARMTDRRPANGLNYFVLAWVNVSNGLADIYGARGDGNGDKVGNDFQIAGGFSDHELDRQSQRH